jgi:flagella basal body P-ring formation protein FlgA
MRCKENQGWTAFIPVEVKVFAQVPVAARPLSAGEILSAADLRLEERDLTKLGSQPLPRLQDMVGRVLLRGFAPGQVLLSSASRAPWVVTGGDEVKVVVHGDGFFVTTSATALNQAEQGKSVPVRLANGRTLQGVAQPGRIVEVKL